MPQRNCSKCTKRFNLFDLERIQPNRHVYFICPKCMKTYLNMQSKPEIDPYEKGKVALLRTF